MLSLPFLGMILFIKKCYISSEKIWILSASVIFDWAYMRSNIRKIRLSLISCWHNSSPHVSVFFFASAVFRPSCSDINQDYDKRVLYLYELDNILIAEESFLILKKYLNTQTYTHIYIICKILTKRHWNEFR